MARWLSADSVPGVAPAADMQLAQWVRVHGQALGVTGKRGHAIRSLACDNGAECWLRWIFCRARLKASFSFDKLAATISPLGRLGNLLLLSARVIVLRPVTW